MPTETAKSLVQHDFLRSRGDDRALSEVARRQYGVVGRVQLLEAGWSREEINWRIGAGRLHRIHAGVYSVGHRLLTREGRWMAAVLASGPDAVLSHWSAAALWMIRPNSRSVVDVTTPQKSRSWKGIRRHHSPRIERYPGRRGVRKVRAALERLKEEPSGRRRRGLEERFAPFLRRHRLPLPRFNAWISLNGRRYQVDCHWPGTRQIVELDGWQGHSTRTAFREDRARDRALRVAGYSVTRLTWAQLDDEPEAVSADLRVLLGIGK